MISRRLTLAVLLLLPLTVGFGWFDTTKSRMEDNFWHPASLKPGGYGNLWHYDLDKDVRFIKGDVTINGVVYGEYKFIDSKHISFHTLGTNYGLHLRVKIFEVFDGTIMQWSKKNPNGSEQVVYTFGRPDTYEPIL